MAASSSVCRDGYQTASGQRALYYPGNIEVVAVGGGPASHKDASETVQTCPDGFTFRVADCPIMSCPLPQSTVLAGCICTHFRAACRWLDDLDPLFVANVKSACTIGCPQQSSPVLCWVARHHRSRFSHTHQKSHLSTDDWSPLPFCGRYTVHPQQRSRVWLVSVGWQTQRKKTVSIVQNSPGILQPCCPRFLLSTNNAAAMFESKI